MKRLLLTCGVLASFALTAHATLILSNSFSYPDGSLITVSAGSPLGVWTNHSGSTPGQVEVSSGKILLATPTSDSEDVSSGFAPIASGNLYASMVINVSALPVGSGGTYFFHFADGGTGFKARVWGLTNGAAPATYRVGITVGASTASPVVIPTDLAVGTDYKLVVRYNMDQINATLWIDPNTESTPVNTATATDATPTVSIVRVAFRENNASLNPGSMSVDNLLVGTVFSDVATVGGAPTISGMPDQSIPANSNTGPIPFLVGDVETPLNNLVVSATSDNTALVPNNPANLTFGGSGANRTLTVTPAANQQGQATISVVVTDGDNFSATNSFNLKVGAPSISTIANQTILTNTATAAIPFTVFDYETPNGLSVTSTSSNPTLVQDSDIVISGTGTNRTVKVTPQANQNGVATITLTVSDGTLTANASFILDVYANLGLILSDDFSYPDGYIVGTSGGFWVRHSGLSDDANVVSAQLLVSTTNADDVHAGFSNFIYFAADSGMILYSKFTVNFLELPRGSGGDYFAHYKDLGTSNFRARIFAMTNGAAPGKFRLGVANGGFTVAAVPKDLNLGTTYTVVTRYNVSSATSTIWVDPHYETSPSATATDATTAIEIDYYCFRQDGPTASPTQGIALIDNLQIGTSFTDVVPYVAPPAPIPLNIQAIGNNAVITWDNPAFSLQSASSISGGFTTVSGASSPYTNTISASEKYFRLIFQ